MRPTVEVPEKYKEAAPGWKIAEPQDEVERGEWWKVFKDPQLDELMCQLDICNQNIIAVEAQFRQACALVEEAMAGYFPVITGSGSATRQQQSRGTNLETQFLNTTTPDVSSTKKPFNVYNLTFSASWEPDLWGSVARTVEASQAGAQSTAALLAATKLSAQGSLAQFYFQLRALDEIQKLLDKAIDANKKILTYNEKRYQMGVGSRLNLLQAQIQLQTAQVKSEDNRILRGQYEHAIAVLIGISPAAFSIKPRSYKFCTPKINAQLPCALLERRPDIAQAERLMAQANAEIGVAKAAFFPSLTFSSTGGYNSQLLDKLFSVPARFWSIGAQLAETIFDGGLRQATMDAACAGYDQAVAAYRQTVISAFQDVEDNLVSLCVLESEEKVQKDIVSNTAFTEELTRHEYQAGTASTADVLNAALNVYTTQEAFINLESRKMVSIVGVIKALGGGWDQSDLKCGCDMLNSGLK